MTSEHVDPALQTRCLVAQHPSAGDEEFKVLVGTAVANHGTWCTIMTTKCEVCVFQDGGTDYLSALEVAMQSFAPLHSLL